MHVEFIVEELSAEVTLRSIVPAVIGPGHEFVIHAYQGKRDLLRSLPGLLRGYAKWLPSEWRIVVLVDRDQEDCHRLKARLEAAARAAGLLTHAKAVAGGRVQVLNRIAVEELEAWFLGDADAVRAAYPRVSGTFERGVTFRKPDEVKGGTWEALERLLQRAGYYPAGLPKVQAAGEISVHMTPDENRSPSFRVFRDGLRALVAP